MNLLPSTRRNLPCWCQDLLVTMGHLYDITHHENTNAYICVSTLIKHCGRKP